MDEIRYRIEEGLCVVTLRGNLYEQEARKLQKFIDPILEDEETSGLIINLSQVEFIDSTSIGSIIALYQKLIKRNLDFAICNLNEHLKGIFATMRLDNVLSLYPAEEDAITALKEKRA